MNRSRRKCRSFLQKQIELTLITLLSHLVDNDNILERQNKTQDIFFTNNSEKGEGHFP